MSNRKVIKEVLKMYNEVKEVSKDSYICGKGIRRYMVNKEVKTKHFDIITEGNIEEIANRFEKSAIGLDGTAIIYDGLNPIRIIPMSKEEFLSKKGFDVDRALLTDNRLIKDDSAMDSFRSRDVKIKHASDDILQQALELRYEGWYINCDSNLDILNKQVEKAEGKYLYDLLKETVELKSQNRAEEMGVLDMFGGLADRDKFKHGDNRRIAYSLQRVIRSYNRFRDSVSLCDEDVNMAILLAILKMVNDISVVKNEYIDFSSLRYSPYGYNFRDLIMASYKKLYADDSREGQISFLANNIIDYCESL